MADFLRPCVSLAPWSPENQGYYGGSSYVAWSNAVNYSHSRTPWVRLWARWHYLQPYDGADPAADTRPIPGWSGMTPQLYLWMLDENIRAAKAAGKHVILTFADYPSWTNGANRTRGVDPYIRPDAPGGRPWLSPADDVSRTGPWAVMAWLLMARYHPTRTDNYRINIFEVCNEPNSQWWPQQDKLEYGSERRMHRFAVRMMETARYLSSTLGNQPLVAGPSLSDTKEQSDTRTRYTDFLEAMFDYTSMAWVDQYVAWTHHNYVDIWRKLTGPANRARDVRQRLLGRNWRGWPDANPGSPYVLLTEGGPVVGELRDSDGVLYPSAQQGGKMQPHMDALWADMRSAPGIGMFTEYLFWSDPGFNCGLLADFNPSGPDPGDPAQPGFRRPIYNAWRDYDAGFPR